MNYVQLHLGDWIAGTLDLTPTERGVYMDLLVRYYKEERPLMQDECKRIARGYAPAEQEAMHYVLQRFFTLENGEYRQSRCDEEIEKAQAVSNKRKRAAASRWAKKPEIDASAYPFAEQTQCECNANGMLTNNRKPITNKEKDICAKPSDFAPDSPDDGFALEQEKPFSESGNVPVQKIVDIYNEVLGESLGRVKKVTPSRAQAIRNRWRDILDDCECADTNAGLEMVRDYFKAVSQSNFLMGRTNNPSHSNWRADFDFLLRQKTYTGILEQRYANGR